MPKGVYARKPRQPVSVETLLERFESKYIPEPNSGCFLWIGANSRAGYGQMMLSKPRRLAHAHRISYELHRGEIPQGMHVLHRCDNPPCVNPDHLFLGTHSDNCRDRIRKGRSNFPRGTKHHNTTLTEDMVREIRRSPGTLQQLADRFGVHNTTISNIERGVTWKHVESTVHGKRRVKAKISATQAMAIKISSERGCDLAKKYGLAQSTISEIRSGQRWKQL